MDMDATEAPFLEERAELTPTPMDTSEDVDSSSTSGQVDSHVNSQPPQSDQPQTSDFTTRSDQTNSTADDIEGAENRHTDTVDTSGDVHMSSQPCVVAGPHHVEDVEETCAIDGESLHDSDDDMSDGVGEDDDDELRLLLAQVRKTLPLEEGEIMDADRRTEVMDVDSGDSGNKSDNEASMYEEDYSIGDTNQFYSTEEGAHAWNIDNQVSFPMDVPSYYDDDDGGSEWSSTAWAQSRGGRGRGWKKSRRGGRGGRGGQQSSQASRRGRNAFPSTQSWAQSSDGSYGSSSSWFATGGQSEPHGNSSYSSRTYVKSDPALVINLSDESDTSDSDNDSVKKLTRRVSPEKGRENNYLSEELRKKKEEMERLKKLLSMKRQKLLSQKRQLEIVDDTVQESAATMSSVRAENASKRSLQGTRQLSSLQETINEKTSALAKLAAEKKLCTLQLQKINADESRMRRDLTSKRQKVQRLEKSLEKARSAAISSEKALTSIGKEAIRLRRQASAVSKEFDELQAAVTDALQLLAKQRAEALKEEAASKVPLTKEEKVRQLQELLEREKSHLKDRQETIIQEQKTRVEGIAQGLKLAENMRLAKLSDAAAAEASVNDAAPLAQKARRLRRQREEMQRQEQPVEPDRSQSTVSVHTIGTVVDLPQLSAIVGREAAIVSPTSSPTDGGAVTFCLDSLSVSSKQQTQVGTSVAGQYISPLRRFRAYRLSPYFKSSSDKLLSPEVSIAVDPSTIVCRFELRGTCNDPSCPWQHFSDRTRTPPEALQYLADLLQRRDGSLPPSALDILKKASRFPAEISAKQLVTACNQAKSDCHFIPLDPPPPSETSWLLSSSSKRAALSTPATELLGIKRSDNDGGDDAVSGEASLFGKELSGLEAVPLYETGPVGINEKTEKSRYYLSRKAQAALEEQLKQDSCDVGHWIRSALSNGRDEDVLTVLKRLSKGIQVNSSSVELWTLYVKFFFRAGKNSEATSLLERATNEYVPFSYTMWHMRWRLSASVSQKLSVSIAAVERFTSDSAVERIDPRTRSASILSFLMSHAFILLCDGKVEFVQRRLTFFLLNAASPSATAAAADPGSLLAYPGAAAFLGTPAEVERIWNLLVNEDKCVIVLQLVHLVMIGRLALDGLSFYKYMRPFVVDWSVVEKKTGDVSFDAKRMLTSALFKAVAISLQQCTAETISFYACYIAFELAFGNVCTARELCQEQLSLFPESPELITLYAESEMIASAEDSATPLESLELCFGTALRAVRDNAFLWYRYSLALLSIGQRDRAVAALVSFVTASVDDMVTVATPELVRAAQKTYCSLLQVEFRGAKEADDLLRGIEESLGHFDGESMEDKDSVSRELIGSKAFDVYVWLSFTLLLSLTSVESDVLHVFHQGILQLSDHTAKTKLLSEYFKWRCTVSTSEAIFNDLDMYAAELGPVMDTLLYDEIAPSLYKSDLIDVLLPAAAQDYSFLEQMTTLILARFPARKCESILQLLIRRYPKYVGLRTRLGDLMAQCGRHSMARRSFVAALKLCPQLEYSWQRLLELEREQSTEAQELRFLFQAALRALPESFTLWGQYQEFEMAHALKAKKQRQDAGKH